MDREGKHKRESMSLKPRGSYISGPFRTDRNGVEPPPSPNQPTSGCKRDCRPDPHAAGIPQEPRRSISPVRGSCRSHRGNARIISVDQVKCVAIEAVNACVRIRRSANTVPMTAAARIRAILPDGTVVAT